MRQKTHNLLNMSSLAPLSQKKINVLALRATCLVRYDQRTAKSPRGNLTSSGHLGNSGAKPVLTSNSSSERRTTEGGTELTTLHDATGAPRQTISKISSSGAPCSSACGNAPMSVHLSRSVNSPAARRRSRAALAAAAAAFAPHAGAGVAADTLVAAVRDG